MFQWDFCGRDGFASSAEVGVGGAVKSRLGRFSLSSLFPSSSSSSEPIDARCPTPRLRFVKTDRRSQFEAEVSLPLQSDVLHLSYPATRKFDCSRWLSKVLARRPQSEEEGSLPTSLLGAPFRRSSRSQGPIVCDRLCDAMFPAGTARRGRLRNLFGVEFKPRLYSGAYGPHGFELVDVRAAEDSDGSTTLVGLKVSGDVSNTLNGWVFN